MYEILARVEIIKGYIFSYKIPVFDQELQTYWSSDGLTLKSDKFNLSLYSVCTLCIQLFRKVK